MLLGPITLVDCVVFLIFLVPQLILQAGLIRTVGVVFTSLPFFCLKLPYQFIEERFFRSYVDRTAWILGSSLFEDIVIRCVRYAFAFIPPDVGGVFFSSKVALPFIRWRMLRHGYLKFPVCLKEIERGEGDEKFKGIWIMHMPDEPPDLVLYYIHGGFVLGSSYFYLEFLTSVHHWLLKAGYKNPAIFALEYTLAPKQVYPFQLKESIAGYKHVLEYAQDPSKVCVAGDSAGGCLVLSLLLELAAAQSRKQHVDDTTLARLPIAQSSVLLSPWVTIKTELHNPSGTDYLDREALWEYGFQYAKDKINESPASPGLCYDDALWKSASPTAGFCVIYGDEEVFAPDIEDWMTRMNDGGIDVEGQRFAGDCGIHAWPVVSLFLSSTEERRMKGLRTIVSAIKRRSPNTDMGDKKKV